MTDAVDAGAATGPKNIVYIMLDDADFFDFGFLAALLAESGRDALTPNIDALRAGGRFMSQFYDASAVCTPTRISVLTGDHPMEHGANVVWPQLDRLVQGTPTTMGLPSDIPLLGRIMQSFGLSTGHFGKWHVGMSRDEYGPAALGFEDFGYYVGLDGQPQNGWAREYEFVTNAGREIRFSDYPDIDFADQAMAFVDRELQEDGGFFLNWWPVSPHSPWQPPSDFDNSQTNFDLTTERGRLLAMMYTLDQQIGRLTAKLREAGELDDTLIMITSDNGGAGAVQNPFGYLNGTKATVFEGGVRVPLIAFWPNGIAAGSANDSVMTTADLLPTLIELMGGDPASLYSEITGRSVAPALTGDAVLEHDPIFWEVATSATRVPVDSWQPSYALRVGDYKIIKLEGRDPALERSYRVYDLSSDPGETTNLLATNPELFAVLNRLMAGERAEMADLDFLPERVDAPMRIDFDPRMDVGARDVTLTMTLTIDADRDGPSVLFSHTGAQLARVLEDGSIEWRVTGAAEEGVAQIYTLRTGPLAAGTYELVFRIDGNKGRDTRLDLLVDGGIAATLRPGADLTPLMLWSSTSDWRVGDYGLAIDDLRWFNNALYGDALTAERYVDPEIGTASADRLLADADGSALFGLGGNDALIGGEGADHLEGGSGRDSLTGAGGDDRLVAGPGDDRLDGGSGHDTASFALATAGVAMSLRARGAQSHADGTVTLVGIEGLAGSDHADRLSGDAAVNTLSGGGGADFLFGDRGNDRLLGEDGNDELLGGVGSDVMLGGDGDDALNGQDGADVLDGGRGDDRLLGSAGADTISGGDGADALFGGTGQDRLEGGNGDDVLSGGQDRDVVTGGSGADRFVFRPGDLSSAMDTPTDRITDFDGNEGDRIDLSGFDRVDAPLTFIGAAAFSGRAGEVRLMLEAGIQSVALDLDGDLQVDCLLRVDSSSPLVAADFIF